MLVKLRTRAVRVRKANSHLLRGADRFTNSVSHALVGYAGRKRFILSLGTDNAKIAANLLGKINEVVATGARCPTWLELADRLPSHTFEFIARNCDYTKAEPLKLVPTVQATWQDLRKSYESTLDRKIQDGEMVESTKTNYLQSLKEFDKFVEDKGYTCLEQITEDVIVEEFKPCRKKSILGRSNAGKRANRLAFDQTILRAAFNHTKSKIWLRAGFVQVENPVPAAKRDQKPGANPENKTMPFTAEELSKLQESAALKYVEDSKGRRYALKFGTDLLALELLRRTGLRRCDAATLRWEHIRFDVGEGMLQVNAKKNGEPIFLPIHKSLGPFTPK
jgi:site-specific recombinase XerD